MAHRNRCEVCSFIGLLIGCESMDEPLLYFCPKHYIEHVKGAHEGIPHPGCVSLHDAREWCREG